MRKIDKREARETLLSRQAGSNHIDPRLLNEIESNGDLYVLRIEDEDSFLSLIWQESTPSRLLTPYGEARTLRDVGARLIQRDYTFERLNQNLGLPTNQHQPEWFAKCVSIDTSFDFSRFGWIAIVSPTDAEQRQSPFGSFYIFDGIHKTLVLTKRLLRKESVYQPIDALFLVPRRR